MSAVSNFREQLAQLPLDPSVYALNDGEKAFFKNQTHIASDEELKQHILAVQAKAYKVYAYQCIRRLNFTKLKISRHPAYSEVLSLGRKPNAILLDFACCFGNDARKAVADGFPANQVIAADLRPEFWALGHELFRSDPNNFPVRFIPGNVLDSSFLSPEPSPAGDNAGVDSQTLRSLNPFKEHISAIHVSSFFHLFAEEDQRNIAHRLATLLSPESGSMIFGFHTGSEKAGPRWGRESYDHSPETWKALWNEVFPPGSVETSVMLEERDAGPAPDYPEHIRKEMPKPMRLVWSVRRL